MITEATTPSQPRPPLGRKAARPLSALAGVARGGPHRRCLRIVDPDRKVQHHDDGGIARRRHRIRQRRGATVADAKSNATIGSSILVNSSGMTLYKFSADTAGMSACSGTCATAWPPLTVASGTTPKGGSGASGTFGTITRSDGTLQVTHNGDPLYTFSGDTSAGANKRSEPHGQRWDLGTVVTVGSFVDQGHHSGDQDAGDDQAGFRWGLRLLSPGRTTDERDDTETMTDVGSPGGATTGRPSPARAALSSRRATPVTEAADEEGLRAAFLAHSGELYGYARRSLNAFRGRRRGSSRRRFIRAWRARERFRPRTRLPAHVVVRHRAPDRHRPRTIALRCGDEPVARGPGPGR